MKNRILAATAFLCLFAGSCPALTFGSGKTGHLQMTALRSVVIWDGQREHLFIQARFQHTTGRIALVIPLVDGASSEVPEDPAVFQALNQYLAARSAAAGISEWPTAHSNLKNVYRGVMKGAEAKDRLRQHGFSGLSLRHGATYAVVAYEVPDDVAASADEPVTELLHFSFTTAGACLPVAECRSLTYFFSARTPERWADGLRQVYAEPTPYYWAGMLNVHLSPVRDLFGKSRELRETQCFFYLIEGSAAGGLQLAAVRETPRVACVETAEPPLQSAQSPPVRAGLSPKVTQPTARNGASLRDELAQLSGIASADKFAESAKNMTPDELQELAEALEARADTLRRFIYEKRPPSDTLKKFRSIIRTADLTGGGGEEENAKLIIRELKNLFTSNCWDKKIRPILDRKGPVGFIKEGRDNAGSYEWSLISQVIARDSAALIVETARMVGDDAGKRQVLFRQKYTLRYVGKRWLVANVEQAE